MIANAKLLLKCKLLLNAAKALEEQSKNKMAAKGPFPTKSSKIGVAVKISFLCRYTLKG